MSSVLSGVMYQKLVAGSTFNVGSVLNDQSNRMVERMIIECNTSGGGGAINIQLPTWASIQNILNLEISVVDTGNNAGTNNIIITPGNGNTINNNATFTINSNKGAVFLIGGTNTNWSVMVATNSNTSTGGGSGTVTNFSSGDFTGLFTTQVTNPTTTPAQAFTPVIQDSGKVFASPVGTTGSGSFRVLQPTDINQALGQLIQQDFTGQNASTVLTFTPLQNRPMAVYYDDGGGYVVGVLNRTYIFSGNTITWTPALTGAAVSVEYYK